MQFPTPDTASSLAPPDNRIDPAERYSRQILFPGIGEDGQVKLRSAHVAIVGVGATGAAAASLLARAGVGTLTLIDRDFVETSNLQRQVLFDEADARDSLPKAEAARRKIELFNSGVRVLPHIVDLVPGNIHALLAHAHLILDATDNFETRYLINDFAVEQTKPWIYAASVGSYATTMNILPKAATRTYAPQPALSLPKGLGSEIWVPTACLACIFPKPPTGPVETCDTAGILSTAVNLAASIQVTEALKFLTGQPHLMRRTLAAFDLWNLSSTAALERSEISTSTPDPACTVCAKRVFTHLAGEGRPHITLCGRDSVQIHERNRPLDLAALARRLARNPDIEDLRSNDLLLRFRRGTHTLTVFGDGRAVIGGTTDITLARTLYARFIGS